LWFVRGSLLIIATTEDKNYRPSLGPVPQSKIPWYEPVDRLGQIRPDAWYAVDDPAFWESMGPGMASQATGK
jgi:hypothetical protein